ncbi:MAG: hypothetical protein HC781_12820 [Leptolyngbyaceae cyanobacterium CSU_1_4]|nr:hypothetical protein [Leptolyngbyaceae cyanobacterium CSU_1_4]
MFLDASVLQPLVEQLPPDIIQKVQLLVDPIDSVALSHYGSDAQGQHHGVLIQLKNSLGETQ